MSVKKYLTLNGLTYFFNKIKTYLTSSTYLNSVGIFPNNDNSVDLGASSKNIKMIYTKGITINGTQFLPSDYATLSGLSAAATSGSYNDLSNKPTIPTKVSDLQNDTFASIASLNSHVNNSSVHLSQSQINTWNSKANASHTHSISDVTDLQSELDDIRAEITAVRETGGIRAMENSEIGELSWN